MANLHIAEFSGLASMDQSTDQLAYSPDALLATQSIAIATTTPSAAFQPNTRFVKLTAGAPCCIAFGPVGTVTAASGGWFLNTGESIVVRVVPNGNVGRTGAALGTNGLAVVTEPTP
jgi:hypothetical protein